MATNPMPYTFGTATSAIPLSQLDTNFATPITLGNTAVYLNNTYSSIGNLSLANVTITSGTITITNVAVTTANVSGTANISTLVVTANASVAGNVSVTGLATLASSQITGATFPASGSGLEVVFQSGTSKLQSFNRTGSAYLPLTIDGTTVGVLSSGATIGAFSSTGLAVTGTGSFTNIVNITRTGTTNLQLESPTGGSGISFRLAGVDKWGFGRGIVDNSNTLQWYDNDAGSTRMALDASGNLLVGNTTGTSRLAVNLDNSTAYANTAPGAANCTAAFTNGSAHTSGGTFVGYQLNISGNSQNRIGYFGAISESTSNQGLSLVFGTNTTAGDRSEKMRLDSSGNLLVGTTSTAGTVVGARMFPTGLIQGTRSESTNAATQYDVYSTGAAAYRFYVGMGGTIFATSIVITAISDERLKENVRDIDTGLNSIMSLKPRRFDWKEGKGQDKKNAAGFIAQEFEDVFPECVSTSKAGEDGIEYKNINHETLIPTLVKAIQELKTEFDAYKASHP
jgi:hypothetical protein